MHPQGYNQNALVRIMSPLPWHPQSPSLSIDSRLTSQVHQLPAFWDPDPDMISIRALKRLCLTSLYYTENSSRIIPQAQPY